MKKENPESNVIIFIDALESKIFDDCFF